MCVECDECKKPCDPSCPVRCLPDVEKMRIFGNGDAGKGYAFIDRLCEVVRVARMKHPEFATSKAQALNHIGAEYGELLQAAEKGEGEEREIEEAFDLMATTLRLIEGEHKLAVKA